MADDHVFPTKNVIIGDRRGRQGHLSNEECAQLLQEIYHPALKHVHLAHLSSECNSPQLALDIVRRALAPLGAHVDVSIAFQDQNSKAILF